MTNVIRERRFFAQHDRGRDRHVFSDLTLESCRFEGSSLGLTKDSTARTHVRRVALRDCTANGCFLFPAVLEDITVENLDVVGRLFVWGALFKHVHLIGRIGDIKIHPAPSGESAVKGTPAEFDRDRDRFYSEVDWALDVSRAEFTRLPDIRGIPGRLIRRDPETQVVVTRDSALRGAWRGVDLGWDLLSGIIDVFLDDEQPELLLVAPKKAKSFREVMTGIERLREIGIAQ